jgi:hypothetical protein
MSHHSIPGPHRRLYMLYAVTIAALGGLFASNARAQTTPSTYQATTWTITIDATGAQPTPAGYSVARNNTSSVGCPYTNTNAANMLICKGDTVLWQAATTPPNQHDKMRSLMWIIHEDVVFDDGGGKATHSFHATDWHTDGGKTDNSVPLLIDHKYHVVVFDQLTKQLYYDDPKIKVGTGDLELLIYEIQEDCSQLVAFFTEYPAAEDRAKKICEENQKLKEILHMKK